MEKPLQQGKWEGEELCVCVRVCQSDSASCGRQCGSLLRVGSDWGEGALHVSVWGGCVSVSLG